MRITIKQRGGFAGAEVVLANLDTATLDPATRASVEQQVQALAAAPTQRAVGADLLEYELSSEDGGAVTRRTWVDDGGAGAQPIQELVARLSQGR